MWQTRAVLAHLLEAAGLGSRGADRPLEPDDVAAVVRSARRRAGLAVALDWAAILLLLLLADGPARALTLGPTPQTVFSLGLLAVAIHSGYRLAELRRFGVLERTCAELLDLAGGG